jgi:predicted O-methyltransferase YrrM
MGRCVVNIEKALAIPGWMSEEELRYIAHVARRSQRILEVGSWQGRSTRAFADNTDGVVYSVDPWPDSPHGEVSSEISSQPDWLFNQFRLHHADNLASGKVSTVRGTSVQGAETMRGMTFDAIFIDASHDYGDVKADILAWRPLLAPNGILCGHDLYPNGPFWPGVKQAVDELVVNYFVVGTIWTAL